MNGGFYNGTKNRDKAIEFLAMPLFDQMPMFYMEDEDSPVFDTQSLTDYDKMVIYLKKVSNYIDLIAQNRNLDKLVKNIVNACYEDEDCSVKDAKNSDDMYALATACYYSQKDFSNRKQYEYTINPIIKKMKRSRNN